MLNLLRTLFLSLLLIFAGYAKAQQERKKAAISFLQESNLDSARYYIDLATVSGETALDAETWYIRGFIYKSIYNQKEKNNPESPTRVTALSSFKKSLQLNPDPANVQENVKNIKYLASTLYNDAASSLDSVNYPIAISNFAIYKDYYPLVDSSKENIRQKEIDFSLAIASLYTKIFESNRILRADFLALAKEEYNKVLILDPNNIGANYNMGILYYNQAVNLIKQSDYAIDIAALSDIQDNSINLFKESLPFMEKAYALDPKRKETLLGLSGIYFSLNEPEKSNLFKLKLEEIEKQK